MVKYQNDCKWRITGFYGGGDTNSIRNAWNMIRKLSKGNQLPWMVFGDFNELMRQCEKKGDGWRPKRQIRAFREVLEEVELMDLGFSGS